MRASNKPGAIHLDSRKIASERRRSHDHYLKGTLYCGSCGSRMQLDYPANKQGVRYGYYVCSGRASKRKNCTRRAVPIGVAEQLVADCYQDIAITEADYTALAAQVEAAFDERLASRSQELAELTENRQRLQNESDKLLAAHFADAIDLETLKRHQDRIRTGLADIDRRLASEHDHHTGARKQLSTALSLLVDCATLYARTNDQGKRLANQALTDGIEISEDERATIRLAEPLAALTPEPTSTDVRSSSTSSIVEVARQCSNLAPALQLAVSSHRAIRRRRRPAPESPTSARALPRPVPRLTVAMLGEAERRYKDGEILRAIAGDLGVSRQRLAVRLRERGVRLRGEKPSSEQVREMCLRYEQGESLATVGERMGFNASSVRVALIAAGVKLRDTNGRVR
ncbi:recombinase zinc beta ribbon domain-containing protein [Kocuria carniphila]|uniref:Recombinase zinc beta ribbon domain-containing protein n=2 Tax=Actinomycetes TaxID=1760 RepID=A0ABV3V523_9MICC